jgi:hypothetical protein
MRSYLRRLRVPFGCAVLGASLVVAFGNAVDQAEAAPVTTPAGYNVGAVAFFPSVAATTPEQGWPHRATWQEKGEVGHFVSAVYVGTTGVTTCAFRQERMGLATCIGRQVIRGRNTRSIQIRIQVYEDGSARSFWHLIPNRPGVGYKQAS